MTAFTAPDGTRWGVEVGLPGSSNAMIFFRHPDGASRGQDRYNWIISQGPEARSVTSRLSPSKVLEQLNQGSMSRLFRRSMPITRSTPAMPEPATG